MDSGFENGTDGAALKSSLIVVAIGYSAARRVRQRTGKERIALGLDPGTERAYLRGRCRDQYGQHDIERSRDAFLGLSRYRNQFRIFDEASPAMPDRAYYVQFSNNGNIYVYTDRPDNPNGYTSGNYTQVGTYATGWTEMRVVHNFSGTSAQTYQLSMRSSAAAPWTQLKGASATGYDIPFRGTNTITRTHGMLFRAYQNANMWIDDVRYSDSGILDPDTLPPTVPTGLIASDHLGDQGGAIDLTWNASIDNVGVTSYRLYRGTTPGVYGAPITLFSLTNYTDNTVVSGTQYYYAVSAETPRATRVHCRRSPRLSRSTISRPPCRPALRRWAARARSR